MMPFFFGTYFIIWRFMNTVSNNFVVTGKINDLTTEVTSNNISVEVPSSSLSITKSADKNIWSDGILKYSVTITNNSSSNITNGIFKDIINPSYANVIPSSVLVNGSALPFTYNKVTGQLEIRNLNINAGESITITYSVSKKVNDVFVLNNTAYINDVASNTVRVTGILIRNCNNFARR